MVFSLIRFMLIPQFRQCYKKHTVLLISVCDVREDLPDSSSEVERWFTLASEAPWGHVVLLPLNVLN